MLCRLCSQLGRFASLSSDDEYHPLPEYNAKHLQKSSSTCELCRLLLSKAQLHPEVQKYGIRLGATSGKALWLAANVPGSLNMGDKFPLCTLPYRNGDARHLLNRRRQCEGMLPFVHSAAPACFDLVRSWLHDCLDSHERCKNFEVTDLPARLLEVSSPRPGPMSIRVVTTDGIDAKYIALSHTRGNTPPLIMTKSTLGARMEYISFWELTAMFRDAVSITRNLGIRYLWIDSLCIIQDSEEDQRRESAKLRHIYGGSQATISRSAAISCEVGILGPRPAKPAVELAPMTAAIHGSVFVTAAAESWNGLLNMAVLNGSWEVFQESQRLLLFKDEEILWECRSCLRREASREKIIKLPATLSQEH